MPFIEAFRQFQFRVKRENFCNVHVSLVPVQNGEHKTKPTQNSVKELRGLGFSPDIVNLKLFPFYITDSAKSSILCLIRLVDLSQLDTNERVVATKDFDVFER